MLGQAVKMLLAVVCLFAICWGPTFIDGVLVSFKLINQLNYGYLKPMRQLFAGLAYFHSCVNPLVYAFMSKAFRNQFQTVVCRWCCCRWCCSESDQCSCCWRRRTTSGRVKHVRVKPLFEHVSQSRTSSTAIHTRIVFNQHYEMTKISAQSHIDSDEMLRRTNLLRRFSVDDDF